MKLKDLKEVIAPEDRVAIYDRFNRLIEHCALVIVDDHLLNKQVRRVYHSSFHQCVAIVLVTGKFTLED